MQLVHLLAAACESADLAAIESLLSPDVVAVCDGGGLVPAPHEPVRGAVEVALLLLSLLAGAALARETVNGLPGLIARRADGTPLAVLVATGSPWEIATLWIVLNPDKLRRWSLYS
ncbi:siderophore-interacting protein [Actinoplanes sp. TRM 88003]|uniref:Siderophore-interacting protein n=1 Tax=Paractinoplanes aksuensis TaxID=2939490 RepID=A0ABT1DEQ5_9ACTN|nr:siderophore-interacting protein [Actinoplanes aksuensis]MCO8269299.1 siderophore-interacting protein [Actinoplanes aksuensis]